MVDCLKCGHYVKYRGCVYDFRWASGAAGQAVDEIRHVYRCRDYSEIEDYEEYEDTER